MRVTVLVSASDLALSNVTTYHETLRGNESRKDFAVCKVYAREDTSS